MEAKMGAGEFEEGMQCSEHPYRNNLGGICAFCLQEKLGKLVSSSSFPFPFALASPSSPRSFRSDVTSSTTAAAAAVNKSTKLDHERSKSRMISFLLAKKSKNKKPSASSEASLKRSNSNAGAALGSPRRRSSFWSFLSSTRKASDAKSSNAVEDTLSACPEEEEDDESTEAVNSLPAGGFEGKVSRSRSVGCGSRSFSGDLFDRISTGFGDCALRRVESQREGRPSNHHHPRSGIATACMKERVKCAGIIFGGFSSSSSSSSSYKPAHLRHNKSWNWAFPSPMRVFTRPPSSNTQMPSNSNNNLAAIPSLLAVVRG